MLNEGPRCHFLLFECEGNCLSFSHLTTTYRICEQLNYCVSGELIIYRMAENATTDSGRIVKMEVDYSSTCDEKIPECQKLAKEGKIHDALDTLLALEKQTRTVSEVYFDFYLEGNV